MDKPSKDELIQSAMQVVAAKVDSYVERNKHRGTAPSALRKWGLRDAQGWLEAQLRVCEHVKSSSTRRRTVATPDSGATLELEHLSNDEAIEVLKARLNCIKVLGFLRHGQ